MELKADCLYTVQCDSQLAVGGSRRGQDFMAERLDVETAFYHYCTGMPRSMTFQSL